MAEGRRLIAEPPPEVQQAIQKHAAEGTTDSPEYREACRAFSRRHLTAQLDPKPDCLKRMADKPGDEV